MDTKKTDTKYSYLLEQDFIKKITKKELLINELKHINNLIEEEDRNFNKVKISILYGSFFVFWVCISNIDKVIEVLSNETMNLILSIVVVLSILPLIIFFIYIGAQWKMRLELVALKKKLIKKLEKNKKSK